MKREHGEWLLFGVMAALIAVMVILAWIDVPELEPASITYSTTVASSDVANTSGVANVSDATNTSDAIGTSGAVDTTAADEDAVPTAQLRISLNTATAEELMQLDGLGEKTAEKILDYRERYNGFDSVEELTNISGIGEKKLAAWKPYLTL